MRTPEPHVLRRVAQAALAVRDAGLTGKDSLDHPIAIRLPDDDSVWFAALQGGPDDEAIHFARGPLGLRRLRDLADRVASDRECERAAERLDVEFVAVHALAPAKRGALQRAGVLPRAGEPFPDFSAKERNSGRTAPDARDLRRLDALLRALLSLGAAALADPPHGTLRTVTVTPTGATVAAEVHLDDLGRTEAPVRCSDATALWPILDATWVVGIGVRPPLGGRAREKRVIFLLDAEDGRTIKIFGGSREDATQLARELLRGLWLDELEPGFAREMLVLDEELAGHVEAALGPRGVRVRVAASHPAMDAAQARLLRQLGALGAGDDLDLWRAVTAALDSAVSRAFEVVNADPRPVFRAFFGNWLPEVEDESDRAVLGSALSTMTEWGAFSWRRTPRAPTLAERMLREDLDPRSRTALEAHAAATPSLYVVRSTDPASETLVLEDVFTGERVTANDRSLSGSARPDLVIALRVVALGPFRLAWLAGPHFTASELPEALATIERHGVAPSREGLAARPDVLGRLWPWVWDRRKHPVVPQIANADGDPVILQEAVYRIAPGEAARTALHARSDLEYSAADDSFTWTRRTRKGEGVWGDNVILGHLRLIGDELLAETNSERRMQTLRRWLDHVPGLAFVSVRASTLDAIRTRTRPLDDRLPSNEPSAETPEALAALAHLLDEHWRTWPDTPLAMLGGRTPRETCATPAGRAKVGAVVRTITSPHPSYDIAGLRARLLADLGLGSAASE